MGCGSSSAEEPKGEKKKELTKEEFERLKGEIGVGQDYSGGEWWWGHPFGSKKAPGANAALVLATGLLPDYHRDVARLKLHPPQMDYAASKSGNAQGEFMGANFVLGHADVVKGLSECPFRHLKGEISRGNELGYLLLADSAFPRWNTIGLGLPVEKHRTIRNATASLIARLPGRGGFMKDFQAFLGGRKEVAFPGDIDVWWCRMLWRYCLRKQISEKEASDFVAFRQNWLVAAVAQMKEISIAHLTFSMDEIKTEQEKWRKEMEKALAVDSGIDPSILGDASQACLEMISFAGGLSVPQTITSAIAALFQGFMPDPVTEENVVPFVYEVTRLFPAVQGFPWWDKDGKRHVMSLNAALRDPRAWGKDSDKFTLKDVKLYQEKHCGFANFAVAPPDADPIGDAKYCPAIPVALAVTQAAVLAFGTWAPKGKKMDTAWKPKGQIEAAGKPSWWQPFVLERLSQQEKTLLEDLLDRNHTGEDMIIDISPQEAAALVDKIDKNKDNEPDAIKKCDYGTRLFYNAATSSWDDNSSITVIDLPHEPPVGAYSDKNSLLLPFGNIRLPKWDEQWSGQSWFTALGFNFVKFVNSFQNDNIPEELFVKTEEKRKEAIAIAAQAFSRGPGKSYLPISKTPWKDISSDLTTELITQYGFGQLFLRPNKDAGRGDLGQLACDLGALSTFAVRPAFERLGAIAYLKVDDKDNKFSLSAIEWKHASKLVKKGDKEWEHAKFVYRCSLGTYVTAVCHLTQCHWIQANALSTSLRESFSPNHPIRRVMHVNQYNTAYINVTSFNTLFPENGFLHRLSPFPYESLNSIFKHAIDSYQFQTFPDKYKKSDLPENIKSKLPMYEDGLPLWEALREFYGSYLDLYYKDDKAVQDDPQVQHYWKFHSCPPYRKGLPHLTKGHLADQLTQACFDVTGFHEFVGSVVGYVTDPAGAFLQVRPGCDFADLQEMVQSLSLTATTGKPMPQYMSEWSHMLDLGPGAKTNKYKEAKEVWQKMQAKLKELSQQVDERNKKRPAPFPHYNPKFLECSVNL